MTKSPRAIAVDPDPSDLARQFCWLGATNDERAAAANAIDPAPVPKKSVVGRSARNTSFSGDPIGDAGAEIAEIAEIHAVLHPVSETTQRSLVACSHLDVAAQRLLERGQAALPWHARRHLGARHRRQPLVPVVPPRTGKLLGARLPLVEGRRILRRLVQPMLVLLVARRIDHACDMAGA